MNNLIVLSTDFKEYSKSILDKSLPELNLVLATDKIQEIGDNHEGEIIFGDANLIGKVLDKFPALKWVQTTWAGVEPLIDPSIRRDYLLTNARNLFGPLMSEYVFGYILQHEIQIIKRYISQQNGIWDVGTSGSLRGKKLGLLGVGSIGSHLASTARHFGMITWGFTYSSQTCSDVDEYFHGDQILDFMSGLDYLVNTLPKTNETDQLLNRKLINELPERCVLINVGRGSSVDELALVEALQKGKIAGAVLDVFQQEPLPSDHPFWGMPNVLITPHSAATSFPKYKVEIFFDNYDRFINGMPLNNIVNFEKGY